MTNEITEALTEIEEYVTRKLHEQYSGTAHIISELPQQQHIETIRTGIGAMQAQLEAMAEGLRGLRYWAHWANEKMGYDIDPKFPEFIKATEILKQYNEFMKGVSSDQ